MSDFSIYVPELLRLLRLVYADWNDFSHTLFVQDEIEYKRAASSFAREQLSREALAALLDAADYDGFLARLNSVAGKTNLLYMGIPREGDLALIKRGGIDSAPICRAVFDLLHGDGDAADRLDVFSNFLDAGGHPQRWPFATYYLFLLHPEREVFVKPSVTKWLSKFTDGAIPYKQRPSGRTYAAIRDGFHALRDALERAIAPTLPQSLLPGSQPELGTRHPRPDMIDVQSVVYVAHQAGTKDQSHLSISDPNRLAPPFDAIFADAVERLRGGLPALAATSDLADIQRGRDEVYARFGPLFSPAHLPDLTAEEFASFLDFKNNHHWSGIDQYVALVTSDMPALREALAGLLKKDPLAEAYDDARHIKGLGKARITAFLHVARPEQYGVWNGKSEEGLRELGIFPALAAKATEGEQYVAINDVLLRLAEALGIDLWTLDTLWEWLGGSDPDANRLAPYTFTDFTGNTYLTGGRAAELVDMLMDKRQAIFYGPPGTGKTFVARHLGRLLTGLADPPPDRLTVVQFHPAYGYEEFIEGIRPHSEKGDDGRAVIDYPVRPGAFVRFCRVAAQYGDQPCVFIIDEINRGNIPRIFGELMLLLEYRDQSVPLPYSGERFRIPRNVHVIGTMNTADRSIALVDFALRRRFHFARFAADPDLFDRWLEGRPTPSWLGALYRRLTEEAIDDAAYRIGPSIFMRDNLTEDGVRRAWEWSVLPWLREYYFDQPAKAGSWAWDGELLRGIRGEHGG